MDITTFSECFLKQDDMVTRQIAGETIVVPIRRKIEDVDFIFTLNETGTMIWNLLDGRTSIAQIGEAVSAAYDVSGEEALRDAVDFLHSLKAEGLIKGRTE